MSEEEVPEQTDSQKQTTSLDSAVTALARDHTERSRANKLAIFAATVGCVLAIVDLLALGFIFKSIRSTESNGRDIKHVLSILDASSPAGQAATVRSQNAVRAIIVEVDCRNRRAIAHLPPPPVGKDGNPVPCVEPNGTP